MANVLLAVGLSQRLLEGLVCYPGLERENKNWCRRLRHNNSSIQTEYEGDGNAFCNFFPKRIISAGPSWRRHRRKAPVTVPASLTLLSEGFIKSEVPRCSRSGLHVLAKYPASTRKVFADTEISPLVPSGSGAAGQATILLGKFHYVASGTEDSS